MLAVLNTDSTAQVEGGLLALVGKRASTALPAP
jgi:hypothetical protein